MSPRQTVFLIAGIFSIIGIAVSVIIIAIGGGFSGASTSITDPPTDADLWRIGQKVNDGTELNYSLTILSPVNSLIDAEVSINFSEGTSDDWKTNFHVINDTIAEDTTIFLSKKQLIPESSVEEEFKQYFRLI